MTPDSANSPAGPRGLECPECGAPRIDGLDCWGQLGVVLSWEWQDPALFTLHFVTVASYNLQHPAKFTDEALAGLKQAYLDHLDHGTPVSQIRSRTAAATNGHRLVTRPPEDRHPKLRRFEMTIADVYRLGNPDGAANRVRAWSGAIRREL